MSQAALDALKSKFSEDVLESGSHRGDEWAVVRVEKIRDIARWLKDGELEMKLLVDLGCVDYLTFDPKNAQRVQELAGGEIRDVDAYLAFSRRVHDEVKLDRPRFEVYYSFYSVTKKHRLRVKVRTNDYEPVVPSITSVFRTADWWERLAWDMSGMRFEGHPNLKRMLLYEEFRGHPLRKDYPHRLRQPLVPERGVKDLLRGPGPGEGGRGVAYAQTRESRKGSKSDAYD
jgi:NADH-quinone oxidoreductase subunit C